MAAHENGGRAGEYVKKRPSSTHHGGEEMNLEQFTADALRAHVGSNFHVTLEDGRVFDLVLEEVKVVNEKHVSPLKKRDSFSLFFVGPEDVFLAQSTYTVSHD